MSALQLFRFLGEDLNRPPSPSKDILKRRKVSQGPKAVRYWPGRAPEYANGAGNSSEDSDSDVASEVAQAALENDRRYSRYSNAEGSASAAGRSGRRRAPAETIVIERKVGQSEVDPPDGSTDHQRGTEVTVATIAEAEATAPRDRSAIRSRAMAYRKDEEAAIGDKATGENSSDEDDDGEEQYSDSDSDYVDDPLEADDEDGPATAFARPVFVPKNRRLTVLEKQEIEREEQRRVENERKRAQQRKKQSKDLLVKTLVAEEAQPESTDPVDMIDDTDVFDAREYELWKIRELKRVLRDRDERTVHERTAAEVERRRNMTEEERELDNERIDSGKVQKAPRAKMRFLQKYYHKGAFFMDQLEDGSEPLYNRDFNAPTADDCVDKSLMPKSMQVRRGLYGKMGQVKHTHLTAEDTTRLDMPWNKAPSKFKPAGTKDTFARPSRKGSSSRARR